MNLQDYNLKVNVKKKFKKSEPWCANFTIKI